MKWEKIFKHEVASVMDEVKSLALQSAQEGVVVCAVKQKSGRGRRGRVWASPEGGLYLAILLRPEWPLQDLSKMTLLASVAVCEAIRSFSDVQVEIKWPNDILIGESKLAGILTESEISGKDIEFVIVGVGINVNCDGFDDLNGKSASLSALTNRIYELGDLLDAVLMRFEFWYEAVMRQGFGKMLQQWRELCGMIGVEVKVESSLGVIKGEVVDIQEDGGLLIRDESGEEVKILSGDVEKLRKEL